MVNLNLQPKFDNHCFACNSGQLHHVEHNYTVVCDYCGFKITEELLALAPPHLKEYAREQWLRRKEMAESLSSKVLLEILASRGEVVFINPIIHHTHIGPTEEEMEQYKPQEPKTWSYEEAAASEFDIAEGEGGLACGLA